MQKTAAATETAIEHLVVAACGEQASARKKHVYREALRGLVRLAKSECMFEMKTDVGRLTGTFATAANEGSAARSVSLARRH